MRNDVKCPYLEQVYRNLPRILSLFDQDEFSPSFGCGDRNYWAWKLKDFPNATPQGFVNGFRLAAKFFRNPFATQTLEVTHPDGFT